VRSFARGWIIDGRRELIALKYAVDVATVSNTIGFSTIALRAIAGRRGLEERSGAVDHVGRPARERPDPA